MLGNASNVAAITEDYMLQVQNNNCISKNAFECTYSHFFNFERVQSRRAYDHLQSFAIRRNFWDLSMQTINKLGVTLFQ